MEDNDIDRSDWHAPVSEGELAEDAGQNIDFASQSSAIEASLMLPPNHNREDEFINMLFTVEGDRMSNAVFLFFFDLLEDEAYNLAYQKRKQFPTSTAPSQAQGTGPVQSLNVELDMFYIFLTLFLRSERELQIFGLTKLNELAESNVLVKQYCAERRWIIQLLLALPKLQDSSVLSYLFQFIERLAVYNITTLDIKFIFKLFQHELPYFQEYYWTHAFKLLQRIWSFSDGPTSFFNFPGQGSGMIMPGIPKFPNNGYTFMCWINVDAFGNIDTASKTEFTPYLYSLTTEEGLGFSAYFVKGKLNFGIMHKKDQVNVETTNYQFLPRTWYFIAVTHSHNILRKSEAQLFVNGQIVQTFALSYPKTDKPYVRCNFGISSKPERGNNVIRAQVAGFAFFEDLLAEQDIAGLFKHGPNLFSLHGPLSEMIQPKSGISLFKSKPKPIYMFTPKATEAHWCIEPITRDEAKRAVKLTGVKEYHVTLLEQSLFSIGGIQVLLPLFSNEHRPKLSEIRDLNIQIINLISELVKDNEYYLNEMYRTQFFEIMGLLLSDQTFAKYNKWSPPAIIALERLSNAINSFEPLFKQFFQHIYLNYRIWISTEVAVQKLLLQSISSHIHRNPKFFHQLIGIQNLMNILSDFYSYNDQMQKNFFRDNALTKNELIELRLGLLEIVHLLIKKEDFNEKECKSILLYLQQESQKPEDVRLTVDVLQLLVAAMTPKAEPVHKAIIKLNGYNVFLTLMHTNSEFIRLWTVKMLGKIMIYSPLYLPKYKSSQIQKDASAMKKYLEGYNFTDTIYCVLLEILFENISTQVIENPINHITQQMKQEAAQPSTPVSPMVKSDSKGTINVPATIAHVGPLFKVPHMIPVIFELLCLRADYKLKIRALKDFVYLVNSSNENKITFLKQNNWQSWVFALLALDANYSIEEENNLVQLIIDLLSTLLGFCFSQKDGYKVFEETKAFMNHFSNIPRFGELSRKLNEKLLQTLSSSDKLLPQAQQTFHVWQNISHWLFFVEQFIFIAPNKKKQEQANNSLLSMKVHHGEEGLWLDFAMAQKLLGLLDTFMRIDHKKHLVQQLQQHVENVPKTSGFASLASTISQSFATLATGQPSANSPQQLNQQQQELATQLNTVYEIEAGMQRLHLRLLLHSIKEAGAFRATQKIENKRTTFANIKRMTQEYFSSQKIQDSLAIYLQEKAKQFTMELSDIDQVFTKNLNRVRQAIGNLLGNATLLASSNNAPVLNKVLYLVSFIYFVLRHPEYAEPDLQQQLVLLFRDLVVTAKSLLVSNQAVEVRQQLSQMKEEDLVQFFVDGFNNPDAFPLSQWFSQGIVSTLAEDSAAMEKVSADINQFKLDITERMETATMEELDNFKKLDVELRKLTENLVTEADARKRNFRIRQSQQLAQIEHKWKQMLRQLVSERGPLNSPFNLKPKERVFWKIDLTETGNRMHLKLKRHYGNTDIVLHASAINDEKEREQAILDHPASPQRNELRMAQSDLLRVRRSIEHSHDQQGDTSPIEEDWEEIPEELSAELDEEAEKKAEDSLYLKCELVKGVTALTGDLEVSGTQLSFRNVDLKVFKVIPFTNLKSIYSRRYNLRNTALEFFLKDKKSYFFNFEKKTEVTTVMKKILAKKPALEEYFLGPPNKLFKAKAKLTELWRKRMISNFDYLMALNTIAGRTTNDLSQYPVFPWILADYSSPELNLDDPAVYRDLSKPIGALEPTRLNNLIERMNAIDESEIPKFLYGSHYSSSGTVLFYLLRIEPYTTHAVTLQGGKFDFPSRMFWSISDTWKNCLINPSDVKELIPEFFYQPTFLTNVNNLNFGRKPDRQSVSEVILPPWAKTPHEFIQINRAALESEYVSENLHHWIDLIFGYKQKGEEALKAHNLFYYLTYEGQVDIDQIEDPVDRKAILDQINNFGQTPSQLLVTPHPKRMSLMEIERPLAGSGNKMSLKEMFAIRAWNFHPNYQPLVPQPPIVFLRSFQGRLWILFQDGVLTKTEHSVKQKKGPLQLETPPATLPGAPRPKNVKRIDLLSSPEMSFQLDQNKYSLSPDGQNIVMCGQWDNSFNFVKLNSLAVTPVVEHTDVVTALALDGNKLVTASMDCTCLAWDVSDVNKPVKDRKPEKVFYGHDEQLTCVAVSLDLDLVATGSKDSTAILFNYTKGQYIRTLKHESEVSLIAISKWGYVVTYVRKEMALYLWSVNGELLNKIQGAGLLTSLLIDKNGQFVITAGEVGYVSVRTLHLNSLKVAFQWKVTPKVTSMTLIDDEYLAVGLDDGRLYVMLFDPLTFVDLMKKQLNIKSV